MTRKEAERIIEICGTPASATSCYNATSMAYLGSVPMWAAPIFGAQLSVHYRKCTFCGTKHKDPETSNCTNCGGPFE